MLCEVETRQIKTIETIESFLNEKNAEKKNKIKWNFFNFLSLIPVLIHKTQEKSGEKNI